MKTFPTPAILMAAALALASPMVAQAQTFNAKPGAWEMTTTMTGNMIPPDVLAKMPPEKRAMLEKMMAEKGVGNGQTSTRKSCVKKEDLENDNFGRQSETCTTKTISRSSTKLVVETSCGGPPPVSGTVTFEAKTPESVIGSIDQQRNDGSKFHIGIVGKWLGASCNGIPPVTMHN